MKAIIESKLKERNTEDLKNDIIEAMKSNDKQSIIVFSLGLSVLEERLTPEEYELFEESL